MIGALMSTSPSGIGAVLAKRGPKRGQKFSSGGADSVTKLVVIAVQ